jgi:hypothetical protein
MERACLDNIAVRWLTGNQTPDHNTLWRFFDKNREALGELVKQSARVAMKNDLVGMVLHAVDGTKIRARASRETAHHREDLEKALKGLDASINEMGQAIEESAGEGGYRLPAEMKDPQARKEAIQKALAELEEADTKSLQPAEPDARMMECDGRTAFSYNAQAVVDEQNGLIVGQDVVNQENDKGLLAPMIEKVEETVGETAEETVADKGYSSAQDLDETEERGYDALVSLRRNVAPPEGTKPFHASRFTYDAERDCVICPLGQELVFQRAKRARRGRGSLRVYRCKNWRDCPVRKDCSKQRRGRTIELSKHSAAVERQRLKHRQDGNQTKLRKRAQTVEPIFALIKDTHGFRKWHVRNLEAVKAQWALVCTTVNLSKMYRFWRQGALELA